MSTRKAKEQIMNRIVPVMGAAIFAVTPLTAMAQEQTSTVTVNGTVEQACVLGAPEALTLSLGDLTGADGRISTTLAGVALPTNQVEIPASWCNIPSTLSLDAAPLSLATAGSGHVSPTNFSWRVGYDATLTGWPSVLVDPARVGTAATSTSASAAHAEDLVLQISQLTSLDASGSTPSNDALEAGAYSGVILIKLAAQ